MKNFCREGIFKFIVSFMVLFIGMGLYACGEKTKEEDTVSEVATEEEDIDRGSSVIEGTELSAEQGEDEKVGNITWTLDKNTKTLTINGHGKSMKNYLSINTKQDEAFLLKKPTWSEYAPEITHVRIENLIHIGGGAFFNYPSEIYNYKNSIFGQFFGYRKTRDSEDSIPIDVYYEYNLTSVELTEGVKSIGFGAFAYCDLTSVELPEGLKSIEEGAFCGNKNLTTVDIPSTVETIATHAFANCGLTSVELHEGLKSIGGYAFYDNKNLTTVDIPSTVETIERYAFADCGLTSITLPKRFEERINDILYFVLLNGEYNEGLKIVYTE